MRILLTAFVLGWATVASAQPVVQLNSKSGTDTLSSNGDSFVVPVGGMASLRIQTKDSYSGTWEVQCSVDGGTTYDTDDEVNLFLEGASSAAVQAVTDTVGIWTGSIAGCTHIKVIATAGFAASDTVVAAVAVVSGGSSPGSSGSVGGEVTNAGVFAVQPTGTLANDANAAGTDRLATLPGITENAAPTRTDGRNAALSMTTGGAARVMITNAAGAAQTLASDATFGTSTYTEATTTGPVVGGVRNDTPDSLANTTNEAAPIGLSALGGVWMALASDPCSYLAKTHIPIDIVTATDTEITAALAGASNHYYVCSVNLVTAGANNVALVDDDSDGCGSITSGVAGGSTAGEGWNFGANGGLTIGNGLGTIFKTNGTNRVLCLRTSANVQLSGSITVVAAP